MRLKPWNIDWTVRNTFRLLTGGKSLEQERQERMAMLREMLYPGESKFVKPAMTKTYFNKLASDFTVSSIILAKRDGTTIAATGDQTIAHERNILAAVAKEIPDAKYLLIKGNKKTHIIYPDNGSLLVVEAPGQVSPIEMKVLLRRIKQGEAT